MNIHLRSRTWLVVAWIVGALLSGPAAVGAVWLFAAAGFVVLPDGAPKFAGPQGREKDFTEVLATREQTGGSLGMFRQTIAPNSGPPTHVHQAEDEFFYVVSGEFRVQSRRPYHERPGSVGYVCTSGKRAHLSECRSRARGLAGRCDARRV